MSVWCAQASTHESNKRNKGQGITWRRREHISRKVWNESPVNIQHVVSLVKVKGYRTYLLTAQDVNVCLQVKPFRTGEKENSRKRKCQKLSGVCLRPLVEVKTHKSVPGSLKRCPERKASLYCAMRWSICMKKGISKKACPLNKEVNCVLILGAEAGRCLRMLPCVWRQKQAPEWVVSEYVTVHTMSTTVSKKCWLLTAAGWDPKQKIPSSPSGFENKQKSLSAKVCWKLKRAHICIVGECRIGSVHKSFSKSKYSSLPQNRKEYQLIKGIYTYEALQFRSEWGARSRREHHIVLQQAASFTSASSSFHCRKSQKHMKIPAWHKIIYVRETEYHTGKFLSRKRRPHMRRMMSGTVWEVQFRLLQSAPERWNARVKPER